MAYSHITSWQIERGKVETVTDFIFFGSKITAEGDCSHEIKIHFPKQSYDKTWQCIKKQRHHFANKYPYSQSYGFSSSRVQMWELDHKESWVPQDWCFWTVVWRRLLRVPWTARRSNQSILRKSTLNIHWKDWCWSWSSNTVATWCEELTHWKRPCCWERLKAGGEGDDRGWDG